jgi:hypothetical protein
MAKSNITIPAYRVFPALQKILKNNVKLKSDEFLSQKYFK